MSGVCALSERKRQTWLARTGRRLHQSSKRMPVMGLTQHTHGIPTGIKRDILGFPTVRLRWNGISLDVPNFPGPRPRSLLSFPSWCPIGMEQVIPGRPTPSSPKDMFLAVLPIPLPIHIHVAEQRYSTYKLMCHSPGVLAFSVTC